MRRIRFWAGRKKQSEVLLGVGISVAKTGVIGKPMTAGTLETWSGVAVCVLAFVVRYAAIAGTEPQESLLGVYWSGI